LEFQAKYIIANNLPANDSHWDSDDPGWVGKASMSKRHRFLIRRNLHWRWFNALIFGHSVQISSVWSLGDKSGRFRNGFQQTGQSWTLTIARLNHFIPASLFKANFYLLFSLSQELSGQTSVF
jgi:hypothetical protein